MHDAPGSLMRCVMDFHAVPQQKYLSTPAGPVAEGEGRAMVAGPTISGTPR